MVIKKRLKILNFKGEECEYGNCINEPQSCQVDFGVSRCTQISIAHYCPLMCRLAICQCGFDSCLNGGQFIPALCSCICPALYKGTRCEFLISTTLLSTTTTSTTTTISKKVCSNILQCTNGGKFNESTCACECNFTNKIEFHLTNKFNVENI